MNYYDFCDLEDQADELEEKLLKRYNGYGVSIKIVNTVILFDRFIFEIKIPKGTRVDQIGKYAKDVQLSLKLPMFQVVKRNLSVFIVASKSVSTDNSLRRILMSPEYAEAEKKMRIAPTSFHAVKKRDFDGDLFSSIIIWALERETISCNMITDTFNIGWRRANDFLDKLRKLGVVGDMYAKQPRAVLPVEIDDLPIETVDLLISHGHTEKQIKEVLNVKKGVSITT